MSPGLFAALGGAAALLLVGLVALLAVGVASRRRTAAALAEARTDVAELRARLEALTDELAAARVAATAPADARADNRTQTEYVITTAAAPGARPAGRGSDDALPVVPDRAVLSVTLGEPLVKAAALVHGVRRALSPESRNRIAFEMRREVKRVRKQRRRLARQAVRDASARARRGEEAA